MKGKTMAKVFGLWFGGANYAPSDMSHVEKFESLRNARGAFYARWNAGYHLNVLFDYVNREPEFTHTPLVGMDSELWIYFSDPTNEIDPYPDRIIKFGPRGGIKTERA